MLKFSIIVSTIVMCVVAFLIGPEFGLLGLVVINALISVFVHYDRKVVEKHINTLEYVSPPPPNHSQLVKTLLHATAEIVEDYKRLPSYVEDGDSIIIGVVTKRNGKLIPLYEYVDGQVIPLTYQLDNKEVINKASSPLSLNNYQQQERLYEYNGHQS